METNAVTEVLKSAVKKYKYTPGMKKKIKEGKRGRERKKTENFLT